MVRHPRLLAFAFAIAVAAPAAAAPPERAIRQAVLDLLDSWRNADAAKGEAALHPDFRLVSRHDNFAADDNDRAGLLPAVGVSTRAAMIALYANLRPGSWDDRLSDIVVHADPSGIGTLRARYSFRIDGRLTHCGAIALTLYRQEGRWRIVDFADTHHWAEAGEPGGCAPPAAP